jgi:gamma-glutamyltranspeptidase/glutathione hydrolase
MFSPVRGTREMIGAGNNFQVEAGYRILTQGGNAVDAAVAAILAAGVTEQGRFGLGGEMPMLIEIKGQPPVAISGIGIAPAKATVDFYQRRKPDPSEREGQIPPIPATGILAATTPGVMAGLFLALEKYGTKSFAEVSQPAIEYADGFPIGEEFAAYLQGMRETLRIWPSSLKFFYPSGAPPKKGEIFRLTPLANTLRELVAAEKRARGNRAAKLHAVHDAFYKGQIAKRIAEFNDANGGLIGLKDLADTKAEVDRSRTGTYRGYEIHKAGFWTQGPVMIQALNILEGFDLKSMGHNSAAYLHTFIEASKLAYADRDRYYGDPKFSRIPEEVLLSKEYAAERRKLINPSAASMESRPGTFAPPLPTNGGHGDSSFVHDTTCVNVMDRWGNAVSATPSGAWLPSVIAGDTGIPLTIRMQSFVMTGGHPNELKPGKRPRVTLTPTLITKDGKPFLVMSTGGGDNQDQAMMQVFLNIVEFGMPPQEAVEAPRISSDHYHSSFAFHEFAAGRVSIENRISRDVVDQLSKLGHLVRMSDAWTPNAAPTVIVSRDGVLHGGADPRRARFIFGR